MTTATPIGIRRLARLGQRVLVVIVFVAASLLLVSDLVSQHHPWLFDFKGGLYNAGTAILHGRSPYQAGFIAHQAAVMRAGGLAIGETSAHAFSLPVYPAPANLAMVPFAVLPYWLAGVLFTVICVGAMVLGLRLLDVRDWRCYALALMSWPFLFGLQLGAIGPLLLLGTAIIWRHRQRLWPPAIAFASIVVAKVFPWPLGIWMLATKRYRPLMLAAALGAGVTLLAWAVLGFDGLAEYPKMLSNLSYIQEGRSDSIVAVLLSAGVPVRYAQALGMAAAGGLLLLAWRLVRIGAGERRAFGVTIIAVLTATPIVWDHYLVLLFVPIALLSPQLSALWLIPLAEPILLGVSTAIVPLTHAPPGSPSNTVRAAMIVVALQGLLVLKLCRRPAADRSPTEAASTPLLGAAAG
jgi:hypothetical protein